MRSGPNEGRQSQLYDDLRIINDALMIPVYLYHGSRMLQAFPRQDEAYHPPFAYIGKLKDQQFRVPYIATSFSSLFGAIPLDDASDQYLILGPVSQAALTRADFHQMYIEYGISPAQQEDFMAFFSAIPHHLTIGFLRILDMIHHFLGSENGADYDYNHIANLIPEQLMENCVKNVYETRNTLEFNNSLEFEALLTNIVEEGQVDRLSSAETYLYEMKTGKVADNPLRNLKNLSIALVTVLSRAAIRGGVDGQIALQLSDLYIQRIEIARDQQETLDLVFNTLLTYTSQVADIKYSRPFNKSMQQIVDYVRTHTHVPLSVAGIAETFGYSSNYLSAKFKKELGFPLSSFITRTRLEEARQLLQYTDKDLLEISESLCFSDQSHFQHCFRKQYDITPLQYRLQSRQGSL